MAVNQFGVEMDQYATDRYAKSNTKTTTTQETGGLDFEESDANVRDIVKNIGNPNEKGFLQNLISGFKAKGIKKRMQNKAGGEWFNSEDISQDEMMQSLGSLLEYAAMNMEDEPYEHPLMNSSKRGMDYDGV
tara:strand:+ start:862 stop:1257 length:396 start_codon:yes stop_codon:yes gene_type:complete